MTGPASIPLSPPGSVARRGQLALLVELAASWHGEWCQLVEVTSVTRSGEIKAFRPVAHPDGAATRVSTQAWSIKGFVDASHLDPEKAVEMARAHAWPGGQPFRPWADFAEAKEALRAARPAALDSPTGGA